MPKLSRSRIKYISIATILITFILCLWAFWIEPSQIKFNRVAISIKHWHKEHNNLKIAILTDLHVGSPHIDLQKLRELVEQTNRENPDLIVILGDLVIHGVIGGKFTEPEPIAEVLKGLRAPHGTVAVLGNHDWWYNGTRVMEALRQAGILVLENDVTRIEKNGQSFWLAGMADLWTRKPEIEKTLKIIESEDPIIMLTHSPDIFPAVPSKVSITLAGHTHGGQVNLPLVGRLVVPSKYRQRYAIGHIVEQGRHLFVSSGIGTSILPVRFRVPPEIVIMTLATEEF